MKLPKRDMKGEKTSAGFPVARGRLGDKHKAGIEKVGYISHIPRPTCTINETVVIGPDRKSQAVFFETQETEEGVEAEQLTVL